MKNMKYDLILEDKYTTEEVEDYFLALKEIEGFTINIRTGYSSKTSQRLYPTMMGNYINKTHQARITKSIKRSGKSIQSVEQLSNIMTKAISEIKKILTLIKMEHRIWYTLSATYISILINFYESDDSDLSKLHKYFSSKKSEITNALGTNHCPIMFTIDVDNNQIVLKNYDRYGYLYRNNIWNEVEVKRIIDNIIDRSNKLKSYYLDTSYGEELIKMFNNRPPGANSSRAINIKIETE